MGVRRLYRARISEIVKGFGCERSLMADPQRAGENLTELRALGVRMSIDDFQSAVTRLKETRGSETRIEARQQEDRQHLWQYALGLMVLLLGVEGIVASRTA